MSGPLFSFRIDSYPRLMGGRWGLIWLGIDKLRPDPPPVVWAKHFSAHYTASQALYLWAVLNRDAPGLPVAKGRRRHAEQISHGGPSAQQISGLVNGVQVRAHAPS